MQAGFLPHASTRLNPGQFWNVHGSPSRHSEWVRHICISVVAQVVAHALSPFGARQHTWPAAQFAA
jgi:hypothetical protein